MRLLTTHSRLSGSAPAAALRFQIRRGSRSIASSVTSSSRLAPRPTISSRFASSATTTTTAAQNPSNSVTNSSASTIISSSSRPRFQTAKHMSFFKNLFSSSASSETMAKASEKAQKLIDENNVGTSAPFVFSKSWCSFSRSTKKTLNDLGAEYKLVELTLIPAADGDELQDALQQISGQRTVPNVFISQKHIGGNSDVQGLNSQRQLAPLLKSAGAIAA
ncbi:glutaredoxin domain-containing protein [Sarocladium implicatum]|nr:glutaredoxin domain-containing protein [Sarocladium implicatum]